MEVDDWELSAEELDSLERDAFQKIAQLRQPSHPSSSHQFNVTQSPSKPNTFSDSRPQRVNSQSLFFMGYGFLYVFIYFFIFAVIGLTLSFRSCFGR